MIYQISDVTQDLEFYTSVQPEEEKEKNLLRDESNTKKIKFFLIDIP